MTEQLIRKVGSQHAYRDTTYVSRYPSISPPFCICMIKTGCTVCPWWVRRGESRHLASAPSHIRSGCSLDLGNIASSLLSPFSEEDRRPHICQARFVWDRSIWRPPCPQSQICCSPELRNLPPSREVYIMLRRSPFQCPSDSTRPLQFEQA